MRCVACCRNVDSLPDSMHASITTSLLCRRAPQQLSRIMQHPHHALQAHELLTYASAYPLIMPNSGSTSLARRHSGGLHGMFMSCG